MNRPLRPVLAALMAALVLALGACSSAAPAVIELSSPAESAQLLQAPPPGLTVLDVRTPEEFASGRLADAVNLDFYAPDFADQLAELERDTPYFVYCRSGNRSASTIETMKSLGFTEVYELAGGIQAWSQAGLEIVR